MYDLKNFENGTVGSLESPKYKKFMDRMFAKSFLDDKKKLDKTIDSMRVEDIDIVFAQ